MSSGAWVFACLWSVFFMYMINWFLAMHKFKSEMQRILTEAVKEEVGPAVAKTSEEYLRNRVKDFLIEIGNEGKYISLTWKEKSNEHRV